MSEKLSAQQRLFIEEYMVDLNGLQAALRAGYSKTGANGTASRLLANPDIRRLVDEKLDARAQATAIDAMFVLTRLADMIDADPCDIIDPATGCYRRIHDWPITWRRMLSAADVQELYAGQGKDREKIGEIVKYKFIDKLKAYELLGKHVNVQAFRDQVKTEGQIGITIDSQDAAL